MDLGHVEEQIENFEMTDNCEFLPEGMIGVKLAQNDICMKWQGIILMFFFYGSKA